MDWTFAVTIFITIVLGIAAIFLTIKIATKKKPVWASKTTKIIGLGTNVPPELKLIFGNNPVSNVYRTIFTFFNKGRESIREDDVTKSVTIYFKGAQILREPTIKAISKEEIQFSVRQVVKNGDNAAEVSFLYLDHNDGAVIEVLHTKSDDIRLSGNIIGAKEIAKVGEFKPYIPLWKEPSVVYYFIMSSLFFTFAILSFFGLKDADHVIKWVAPLAMVIVSFLYLFEISLYLVYRFPKWSRFQE